ncbi:GNAT family acetyltransferase [Cupriavidus sp. HPC(L)]|uniref:GNAT family N-acetyltransferase n=1 Tax=Cupriavidus sp. HPC(L) TaxID=1217418 RepID=UPI0002918249|nr:GNAT family N-acetyltransferase [Cupriavidus sp. HPC(L)]ESJ11903.1 GNAT family acetyltransferase [Cupriavidus sp. HPC(L)]
MPAVLRAAEIAPFLFARPLAFGDFPQTWTVNGGQMLTARAVRLDDFVRQRAFVDGLSRESRYYRFLTGGLVSDDLIGQFVRSRSALVVTARGDGGGEEIIVANGEYAVGEAGVAELALVVTDRWQGRGIGRRLVQTLVQGASAQRLRALRGEVLSENRRMLAILREHGFSVRLHPDDALLHEATLTLNPPARHATEWLPEDWFSMR